MSASGLPSFGEFLGIKIIDLTPDRVEAELAVRDELRNVAGVMHGGALMGFADSLGGALGVANLKPGQRTSTIESKTNFFAAIPVGEIARAECVPLHRGRSTVVVQTRITRSDGKLAAIVTQTQIVMQAPE